MPTSASNQAFVWHHYTLAALEAQYDLSQHPDRAPAYARMEAASRAVRQELAPAEIVYGDHPRERYELYLPVHPAGAPLFVFIHGGYWRALDRSTFSFIAGPLVARGAAMVNLEYPLAPESTMTRIAASARAGVEHAAAQAARAGIDARRLVVSGHSAGGHLTAHVAAHRPLAGTLPVSGLFELEPLRQIALNRTLGMSIDEAAALSPARHTATSIVAVGGAETDEFRRQSRDYAARLGARLLIVPDANHFTVLDAFAAGGLLFQAACELLF